MEFRITSSTRAQRRWMNRGFTIIEILVALVLGGIITTVIVSLTMYTGINFACLANYAHLDSSTLNAMDRVTREIRAANGITSLATNSITFNSDTGVPVTYSYSSGNRNLTR